MHTCVNLAFIAWKTKLKVVSRLVQQLSCMLWLLRPQRYDRYSSILVFHLLSQLICYLTIPVLLVLLEIRWTMSSPSILVMMPRTLGHECRIMLSLVAMFVRSFIWLTSLLRHMWELVTNFIYLSELRFHDPPWVWGGVLVIYLMYIHCARAFLHICTQYSFGLCPS
jgi:hypothetical protein